MRGSNKSALQPEIANKLGRKQNQTGWMTSCSWGMKQTCRPVWMLWSGAAWCMSLVSWLVKTLSDKNIICLNKREKGFLQINQRQTLIRCKSEDVRVCHLIFFPRLYFKSRNLVFVISYFFSVLRKQSCAQRNWATHKEKERERAAAWNVKDKIWI